MNMNVKFNKKFVNNEHDKKIVKKSDSDPKIGRR